MYVQYAYIRMEDNKSKEDDRKKNFFHTFMI